MTDHKTNPLTGDEIRAAVKHAHNMSGPSDATQPGEYVLAGALALLSKLRAPVADDDMVSIPRGLIGAACSAIDKKRDAPKVLAELRRYTTGDLASAPEADERAAGTPINPHAGYPDLAEAWQKGFNDERPVLRSASIYFEVYKEGQAARAALTSAPVAGEAIRAALAELVECGKLQRDAQQMAWSGMSDRVQDGIRMQRQYDKRQPAALVAAMAALDASPQASDAHVAALSTAVDYRSMGDGIHANAHVAEEAQPNTFMFAPVQQDHTLLVRYHFGSPSAAEAAPGACEPNQLEVPASNMLELFLSALPEIQATVRANHELRAALILARDSHGICLPTDPPQEAWKARRVDEVIRAALSAQPGAQKQGESNA